MKKVLFLVVSLIASDRLVANELNFIPWSETNYSPRTMLELFKQTDFSRLKMVTRSSGADVYQSVAPSVVKIVTGDGKFGSGIVLGEDEGRGIVLTNEHVISGNSTVGIIFSTDSIESDITQAEVVKLDQISDLAALRLNKKRVGLVQIKTASKSPRIGEDVHAIGHPMGQDWTYTRGYISQFRKNFPWQTAALSHHVADVIQTQTPINPGNSGGPLLNSNGELIGINSFIDPKAQGLNYAVDLSSIMEFLKSSGDRIRKVAMVAEAKIDKLLSSIDKNRNGTPDLYLFDYNGNGKVDLLGYDRNEDQIIETIQFDRNENGTFEKVITESDIPEIDGVLHYFDEDEDGKPEAVGIDLDRDGKVDHLRSLG